MNTGRLTAAAIAAAISLAGCQGSAEPDAPDSTPQVTQQHGPYTDEERAVYREAVRRVEEFEAKNQPILAAGTATDEAKEFYRQTLSNWRQAFRQLQSYESDEIEIARSPVVLSTTPTFIQSFQDDAAEVVLSRCTDQSDLGMTKAGVLVPPEHEEPVIQEVVVNRYENRTWLIGPFKTTDTPCDG